MYDDKLKTTLPQVWLQIHIVIIIHVVPSQLAWIMIAANADLVFMQMVKDSVCDSTNSSCVLADLIKILQFFILPLGLQPNCQKTIL